MYVHKAKLNRICIIVQDQDGQNNNNKYYLINSHKGLKRKRK
jgi:hypothetical protein